MPWRRTRIVRGRVAATPRRRTRIVCGRGGAFEQRGAGVLLNISAKFCIRVRTDEWLVTAQRTRVAVVAHGFISTPLQAAGRAVQAARAQYFRPSSVGGRVRLVPRGLVLRRRIGQRLALLAVALRLRHARQVELSRDGVGGRRVLHGLAVPGSIGRGGAGWHPDLSRGAGSRPRRGPGTRIFRGGGGSRPRRGQGRGSSEGSRRRRGRGRVASDESRRTSSAKEEYPLGRAYANPVASSGSNRSPSGWTVSSAVAATAAAATAAP